MQQVVSRARGIICGEAKRWPQFGYCHLLVVFSTMFLQNLASIQPRTSRPKVCRIPRRMRYRPREVSQWRTLLRPQRSAGCEILEVRWHIWAAFAKLRSAGCRIFVQFHSKRRTGSHATQRGSAPSWARNKESRRCGCMM